MKKPVERNLHRLFYVWRPVSVIRRLLTDAAGRTKEKARDPKMASLLRYAVETAAHRTQDMTLSA